MKKVGIIVAAVAVCAIATTVAVKGNFFKSSAVKTQLNDYMNGATQGYLRDIHILELDIKQRSLLQQKEIANQLDTVQCIIDSDNRQLLLLDELVKSKFNEMFGGNDSHTE